MNLNDEQVVKMGKVFEGVRDYSLLVKEHNSAKSELISSFIDELCPKPSGKMTPLDKENYKKQKTATKQFVADTYRIYLRDIEQKDDTTPEALITSEKLRS